MPNFTTIAPRVKAMVNNLIGRVAGEPTMIVPKILDQQGVMRFTALGQQMTCISQKMQPLRTIKRDGLLIRTIRPVIPPRVEYRLTDLGLSLGDGCAVCGGGLNAILNGSRPRATTLTRVKAPRLSLAVNPRRPKRRMTARE